MAEEFNNKLILDNISFLLKEFGKKIGELETESGVSPGYISRLSNDSKAKPGLEFIMKVAESLNTSVDTLLKVDLSEMTPTERYLMSFLEKLNKDTIADKLDWDRESADMISRTEVNIDGGTDHPLLSYETFYEEDAFEVPEEVSRVVFVSNTFGCNTSIHGDCFNLRLKNRSFVYLMNISKSIHMANDPEAYAKEIWIYKPGSGKNFLCSDRSASPLADLTDILYSTVSERMKHPKLKKELQYVIDAFMNDDLSDDNNSLPFDL